MPSLEEMDEDEADAIEEAFDHDYDVAQSFRSHIVPKAVQWFTGEVSFVVLFWLGIDFFRLWRRKCLG